VTPALSRPDLSAGRFRVIAARPGVDQAQAAARTYRELRGRGDTVHITAQGTVLNRRLRALLPIEARRNVVVPYHGYTRELWSSVLVTKPEKLDEFSVDLWQFRELLRGKHVRPLSHRQLIVVQGQKLPVDFYSVIRLLGIEATVFVDPMHQVEQDGSTLEEVAAALGVAMPIALPEAGGATRIREFVAHFDRTPTNVASRHRDAGARPVLVNHRTFDDEVQFVVDYATKHPQARVGLLLPTADLVLAFKDEVEARFTGPTQWYVHGPKIPERATIDSERPGIKILTWTSAAGSAFDSVVLASLHHVGYEFQFETAVRVLGPTAREELVLSYSGQGEPTILRGLPKELMDDRTTLLDDPLPQVHSVPHQATGSPGEPAAEAPVFAAKSPVDIARELLATDRGQSGQRRRVLTAVEEVGLAELMRAGDLPLSEDLPRGFRSALDARDERAEAFDALVHHNIGLVQSNIGRHLGSDLDEEDLNQHGVLGLMRAIEKFDASLGIKFSTYATHWINQSMSRAVADEGSLIRIPVHMHEIVRKVVAVRSELLRTEQRFSITEVCRRTGLERDKVISCLRLAMRAVSLDAPVGGDSDASLGDFIPVASDDLSNPDYVLDRKTGRELVHAALALLNEREATVLRLRFGFDGSDGQTLENVGEHFKFTRERARQIESKAKANIVPKLAAVGLVAGSDADLDVLRPVAATKPARTLAAVPTTSPGVHRARTELASGSALLEKLGVQRDHGSIAGLVNGLVDHALAVGARTIRINSASSGTSSLLALTHDGSPFVEPVLREALVGPLMRPPNAASAAVGAALCLYDELATWSRGRTVPADNCLVLTSAPDTDVWGLREGLGAPPPGLRLPTDVDSTSVVLLRAPRPRVARTDVAGVLERHGHRLGLIWGELLRQRLTISVDGKAITRRDPFLWTNPAAQHLGDEHVSEGGHTAVVEPRVLPHPELLRPEDGHSAGDPARWLEQQGLYVRCEGRYLSCGGWLGLGDFSLSPETALARVLVEIAPGERGAWGFGQQEAVITPPEPLRARLTALVELARRRSRLVLDRHRTGAAT
jgi:RNA polymerase sigma factor (sigma-70 family)